MKGDRYLRGLYARPAPTPRRAASNLRTPLLIAAGIIGVPVAIGLARQMLADDDNGWSSSDAPRVDTATAYPMNHFLPGAGYYHAPYHAWFPMPFNYYDTSRGWFRGGQWRQAAQEDDAERREEARLSGLNATNFHSSGGGARILTSRPTAEAVNHANANVVRGGFGSSARPGIS